MRTNKSSSREQLLEAILFDHITTFFLVSVSGIFKSATVVDTTLSKAVAVVPYPSDTISFVCSMPGSALTRLVGWPIAYALLIHDPANPTDYSTTAPYGKKKLFKRIYKNELFYPTPFLLFKAM